MDEAYKKQAGEWFERGRHDIETARLIYEHRGHTDSIAYHIQQALEKYLKGYLLSKGWELRRIHNLETLINESIRYDPSFDEFRAACQKITQYYVEERYPLIVASQLTEDEIIPDFAFEYPINNENLQFINIGGASRPALFYSGQAERDAPPISL